MVDKSFVLLLLHFLLMCYYMSYVAVVSITATFWVHWREIDLSIRYCNHPSDSPLFPCFGKAIAFRFNPTHTVWIART